MADIHIGKIDQTEDGKGKANLIYHISIDRPKAGVAETPESTIADQLEQTEINALASGTLVEIPRNMVVEDSQTQSEIVTVIKADWQIVNTRYNQRYNFRYKYYGVTLNAGA